MKCLVVADLHYSLKQFDWVVDRAPDFDLVVLAGDHLDITGHVDGQVQTAVVLKYLRRIRECTRVVVSSGNHDLDAHNEAGEKCSRWIMRARQLGISTDGDALALDGSLFSICPWWDGPRSRDDVDAQLRRDALQRAGRWIWVYHSPPDASPTSWGGKKHYGDVDLSRWIAQHSPDIVLTGHIHELPFRPEGSWVDRVGSTWVFNAGRQLGPIPTHIVLDTEANAALWFSLEGVQTVRLDRSITRPIPRLNELPDWFKASGRDRGPNPE